ncbi:hypothetical protein Tco_0405176 [Tanacetum coccineum]
MTTPRPIPFPATTPRAGVLVSFVIISDSGDKITTLPIRPAPPLSDRIPALHGYPLDSGDDSSDEDLSETSESLHTQTTSTSVVHPPSTRPLPTSLALPVDRERRSRCHYAIESPLPSPPIEIPSPLEHVKSVGDDIETLRASLPFTIQETMTLHDRIGLFEQHDVITRDSLRIARGRITLSELQVVYAEQEVRELREFQVTDRLEIIELHSRAGYVESRLEQSHDRQTRDGASTQRTDMTEQDSKASHARSEATEQQDETLQVSLGAARMDVIDLIESREADRFEMVELRS